jgi:hypothetical protein
MFLRVSILVVVLGACVAEVEPFTGEAQQSLCAGWMCGTNSPQIAEFGFWDLNAPPSLTIPGQPNIRGLQILRFVQGGVAYVPRVSAGRLMAIGTGSTLTGPALVNGYFLLANGSRYFKLRVAEVGTVDSWAQPSLGGNHVTLESYKLDWTEFLNGNWGEFRNVCTNPPSRDNTDSLTMTGNAAFQTLLFEGDRIDAFKKLDTGVDNSWFNLGCAGSALAKMALTGHTQAAVNAGTFAPTLDERQTMLKMLAADYCGDGTPYTTPGQPLNWKDDHGTMQLISPPASLVFEARWTPNGAACLNKTRVDVHWTANDTVAFGLGTNVYNLVASQCGPKMPPPCADLSFNTSGYHLLTATP